MNRLLAMLQEEMEGLVLRLASQFQGRKDQLQFLKYKSYDAIVVDNFKVTNLDTK